MATEPLQAAPYAVGTDAPDGPAQLLALASWARRQVVQFYASSAARSAAFTAASLSPAEGMLSWLQDVDRYEKYNGTAWVPLAASRAGTRLRRAANQSVATATTVSISWDTEDEDTHGFIAAPSTTVTIPANMGGLYAITFRAVGISALSGRGFVAITPTVAAVGFPSDYRCFMDTANEDRAEVGVTIPLAAGDSFTCDVFHGTGTAANFTAWGSCYRVGD